ncbi:GAF domain-like protein [Peziza echinospora]|nr:GAF domain-like protein [Peziza echinospora]
MVHADSSNFAAGVTKGEAYKQILEEATELFQGQSNWVCNFANAASLIWHAQKSMPFPSNQTNWAGFYVLDPKVEGQLILGPFMGKVACQTIKIGRGVCGKAAERKETIVVEDVHAFPGHIACDGDTKSEIVVPILQGDKVIGVIDCDSIATNAFDNEDRLYLEKLAALLASACVW